MLVKATLSIGIGKDLGMCTVAYASLMVELQQDGYTRKTRESDFSAMMIDQSPLDVRLGVHHYLPVLYFPVSACQSLSMY